jgi:hypothetical protein
MAVGDRSAPGRSYDAAALDLLAGSLTATVEGALATLRDGGMSHLTSLSLVLAMPGETAEDCTASVKRAISAAVEAHVPRIRFAYWLGDSAPCPESHEQQQDMFLASHPDWHPLEYAGVGDFVELMRHVTPAVEIVGPHVAPDW